jgi:hypothetical protein
MPTGLSRARLEFDEIMNKPDRAAHIRSLISLSPPTFEDDWLDFKTDPGNAEKLKEMWSEALCGLANTEGGVIVWGVDARKTKAPDGTDVDAACGLKLISKPLGFKAKLLDLKGKMTDPPVGGVEVVEIPDSTAAGDGFVVCYVPESTFKPHRMEARGRKEYVYRAGDSFRVLPTSMLRSLFFPQKSTSFLVRGKASTGRMLTDGTERMPLQVDIELENTGEWTKEKLLVVLNSALPTWERDRFALQHEGWVSRYTTGGLRAFYCSEPLHPGVAVRFCRYDGTWRRIATAENPVKRYPNPELTFTIYAPDQPALNACLTWNILSTSQGETCEAKAQPIS